MEASEVGLIKKTGQIKLTCNQLWNFSESGGEVDKKIDDLENALIQKDMLEQVIDGLKKQYETAIADLDNKNHEINKYKTVKITPYCE